MNESFTSEDTTSDDESSGTETSEDTKLDSSEESDTEATSSSDEDFEEIFDIPADDTPKNEGTSLQVRLRKIEEQRKKIKNASQDKEPIDDAAAQDKKELAKQKRAERALERKQRAEKAAQRRKEKAAAAEQLRIEQQIQKMKQLKDESCVELAKLASVLNPNPKTKELIGLPNITGANCYMNAALQHLENNFSNDAELQELLKTNLVKLPEESLTEFEARAMSGWAPLKQEEKEETAKFESRILFKWSFLLLLQAKNSQENSQHVTEALTRHHSICFGFRLHPEFHNGASSQKDSAAYHDIWFNALQIQPFTMYSRVKSTDKLYKGRKEETPVILLPLSLGDIGMSAKEVAAIKVKTDAYNKKKDPEIAKLKEKVEAERKKVEDSSISEEAKEKKKRKIKKSSNYKKMKKLENAKAVYKLKLENKAKSQAKLDAAELLKQLFAEEMIDDVEYTVREYNAEAATTIEKTVIAPKSGKKLSLTPDLPDSFVIQFKRFHTDKDTGLCSKIDNKINLKDMQEIDLYDFVKNPEDDLDSVYELNGFVVHIGGYGAGHYISYVKRGDSWYECDDSTVTELKKRPPPFQDAYLCSYVRVD